MNPEPANIKVIVAAGVQRAADAVKAALPMSFADFAERHGLTPQEVSRCLYGRQRHERVRAALAEELKVEREWLDAFLDRQRDAA